MIYQSTSIEEVLARIVRNTRLQDSTYLQDAEEWIPEAMGYMRTKITLSRAWEDIKVRYHKGKLPCSLHSLKAVQYGCNRLKYYNGDQAFDTVKTAENDKAIYPGIPVRGTTVFGSHIVLREAEDDGVPVTYLETDLMAVENLSFHGEHWYYTEMGYINTSMCDATVRIFFMKLPVDQKGLPLIPDEENYKEALYWYTRAKMIGCGYPDKVFAEQTCMDRFEKYAERAMSKITYPSVDQMQSQVDKLQRLVLPDNYWANYFNPSTEGTYGI